MSAAPPRKGRPPSPEGRVRLALTVPPGYPERLREIGAGNASAGLVRLVDERLAGRKRS